METRTNHNDLYLLLGLVALFATFYFVLPYTPIPEALEKIFIRNRDLVAEHAFAYDTLTDFALYEKDADAVVPLASLTKVMTAVVVAENLPPDERITISERAIAEEVDNGLVANTVWSRDELLSLMLVESSNDAAIAFAEAFEKHGFDLLDSMNAKALELGLTTLHFTSVNGLDYGGVAGGVGSAREVAQLLEYAWNTHADIFSATTQKELALAPIAESAVLAENTNKTILSLPGRVLSKTGMTRMAGGNLGVVVEKGPLHPIIVVVLGSTEYGRFSDVELIVEKAFEM